MFYVAEGPESGCCGHLHTAHDDALQCVREGPPDREVVEVRLLATPRAESGRAAAARSGGVHPTAVIGAGARIGAEVVIGPYAVVDAGAVIGDGCALQSHAVIRPGVVLGNGTRVESFAVIGGDPQDLSFDPSTESGVLVGEGVTLREGVTVHRATRPGGNTVIEDGAYLMANAHVAHDCFVGAKTILANNVMLAGHVSVGPQSFLGGGAGLHQFVRVGEGVMIAGHATVTYDMPPFGLAAERNQLRGLNLVGLRRRQFPREAVADIKRCYREVFAEPGDLRARAATLLQSESCGSTALGLSFLKFFTEGKRGFLRPQTGPRPGSVEGASGES